MIDQASQAAASFYREAADFAARTRSFDAALTHWVTADEVRDTTLISQRVYGRRDESLAVMAAAGMDSLGDPVPVMMLVLPTETQLDAMKKRCGFESRDDYRDNFTPTWV